MYVPVQCGGTVGGFWKDQLDWDTKLTEGKPMGKVALKVW